MNEPDSEAERGRNEVREDAEGAAIYGRRLVTPRKGGEADVEKSGYPSAAGAFACGADDDSTYHKSVLTARWHEQSALGN